MGPLSFIEHSETFNILISKGIDPTTTSDSSDSNDSCGGAGAGDHNSTGEEYELTVNPLSSPSTSTTTQQDNSTMTTGVQQQQQQPVVVQTDKYGFITNMDSSGNITTTTKNDMTNGGKSLLDVELEDHNKIKAKEHQKTKSRELKWETTMGSWERRRPKQMVRRLRKGLPDKVRGKVWLLLATGGIPKPGLYQEIVQKTSDAMIADYKEMAREKVIERSNSNNNSNKNPSTSSSSTPTSPDDGGEGSDVAESPSSPSARNQCTTNGSSSGNNHSSNNNTAAKKKMKKEQKSEESLDYANTQAFRTIQDTIERDIHRTYPRHTLFYEEDPDSRDNTTLSQEDPSWLDGMGIGSAMAGGCDPELIALIKNLESDLHLTINGGVKRQVTSSKPEGAGTPAGQAALRRVLRAYSYYDRDVGYCQGMNFIVGMFLTIMTEEEAFWVLVGTMNEKPCEMRGLFGEGMKETHKVLHVAEKLIHHYLPKLGKHFDNEHIHVTMYATQWLMTQYTSSFKFDLVFRVWDCFLGEGWKIIYRVMLALLAQYQTQLLKMSFEEILTFFRELPDKVDGNATVGRAMKIRLRRRVIRKYESEYAKQQQQQHTGN